MGWAPRLRIPGLAFSSLACLWGRARLSWRFRPLCAPGRRRGKMSTCTQLCPPGTRGRLPAAPEFLLPNGSAAPSTPLPASLSCGSVPSRSSARDARGAQGFTVSCNSYAQSACHVPRPVLSNEATAVNAQILGETDC